MQPVEIRPNIYWVGMNDRKTELFEGLWSIRGVGVSYNSYLIVDKKKVLIDVTSKLTTDELFEHIKAFIDPAELDYIVINHMEPDHSGALKALLLLAPQATLLGSAKTKEMLASFYGITENVRVVADGEEITLGQHTLKFFSTPFVHWPETMMTYETTEKILFSCDGFGGYGTLNGSIFDGKLVPMTMYEDFALSYFVHVVATYSKPVKNAIAKLSSQPIEIIAPSHGLIWRENPKRILDLYSNWADYAGKSGDPGVTMLYASMYGDTEEMMEVIAQGISDEGVPTFVFNVIHTQVSEILPALWLNRGVMIGSPTYEGKLFPDMVHVLETADRKHIYNKLAAGFGSQGWSGGGQRELNERFESMRWKPLGNFEFTGSASPGELDKGREYGRNFARQILAG